MVIKTGAGPRPAPIRPGPRKPAGPSPGPPPSRPRTWIHRLIYGASIAFFVIAVFGLAGLWIGYIYLVRDLPLIDSLHSYRPAIPTRVFSDDGTLIAEFGRERRRMVAESEIPETVKKVFLAAEDHRFLEHKGVDFYGVAGAFWWDVRHPGDIRGASTITMQVARTFFLTRERTMDRKVKEALLALRIETALSKRDILYLYLTQVEMGRGCFGIGEASSYYFGKPVGDLTLGEAAMLAGILPAPSRYNPVADFGAARERQRVVLFDKMVREAGIITRDEAEAAYAEPIKIMGQMGPQGEAAPYFVERVRRLLIDRYGEDKVYLDGLQVFTTVNLKADEVARQAVRDEVLGTKGLDKSIGFRKPLAGPLAGSSVEDLLERQEQRLKNKWANDRRWEALRDGRGGDPALAFEEILATAPDPFPLTVEENYRAVVTAVSDARLEVEVRIGHSRGVIGKTDMAWAGAYNSKTLPPARLSVPSAVLEAGDVVLVLVKEDRGEGSYRVALDQPWVIEAGLFAMSTRSGHVKALRGGVDYEQSQFIRPLQARRQPGSAFKPIIYAAAMDDPQRRFTPATVLVDTAMVFDKSTTNPACPAEVKIWEKYKPKNYNNTFTGRQTLRYAVAHSINTIAARVAWNMCLPDIIDYAHRLGIKSKLDMLPCIALGCSEVTLEELVTSYNVFAAGGQLVEPLYITRVYDRDGDLLEYEDEWEAGPESGGETGTVEVGLGRTRGTPRYHELPRPMRPADAGQPDVDQYLARLRSADHDWLSPLSEPAHGTTVISPQTAYLMNSLLGSVIKNGTGSNANRLGRPLAGKTGTTNNYKDALFVGYSPELVAGVWVGPDKFKYSLGRGVSGSKAALPIWIDFMEAMLKDRDRVDFPVPDGLEWVNIDPATGLRAADCSEKVMSEVFKKGTAPLESTDCHGGDQYYLQNYDRDLNK